MCRRQGQQSRAVFSSDLRRRGYSQALGSTPDSGPDDRWLPAGSVDHRSVRSSMKPAALTLDLCQALGAHHNRDTGELPPPSLCPNEPRAPLPTAVSLLGSTAFHWDSLVAELTNQWPPKSPWSLPIWPLSFCVVDVVC